MKLEENNLVTLEFSPAFLVLDNELLFDEQGHLTEEGLQALVDDRLDELGRLEAAEHLAYCHSCLARYTTALETIPQTPPLRDAAPPVPVQLRMRAVNLFANRYFTAAAAVALAFTLWNVGAFGRPQIAAAPQQEASRSLGQWMEQVSGALGDALGGVQQGMRSGLEYLTPDLSQHNELQWRDDREK